MKRIIHIATVLLSVTLASISCEREEGPIADVQESGRPIHFTTVSEWPDITKAPITSIGDLKDDGFVVWGSWTKDPDDKSYFIGDYASGKNSSVFGDDGTLVSAVDFDSNGVFSPNDSNDTWTYEQERNWYRGHYSFAALLPASLIGSSVDALVEKAEMSQSFSKTGSGEDIQVEYVSNLKIFPSDKLTLGMQGNTPVEGIELPEEEQLDLMYAFCNEDNSDNQSENVSLYFTHMFARLGINLIANNPDKIPNVTKVTIYGIPKSVNAPLELTQTTTIQNYRTSTSNTTTVLSHNIASIGVPSTETEPFAVFVMPEGHYENDLTPEDLTLVQNLVVFPSILSAERPLKIRLDYRKKIEGTEPIEYTDEIFNYTITINQGALNPGGRHSYSFMVDSINL